MAESAAEAIEPSASEATENASGTGNLRTIRLAARPCCSRRVLGRYAPPVVGRAGAAPGVFNFFASATLGREALDPQKS